MFCQYCGAQMADDMRFCMNCGRGVDGSGFADPLDVPPAFDPITPDSSGRKKKSWFAFAAVLGLIFALTAVLVFLVVDPMGLSDPQKASESSSVVVQASDEKEEDVEDKDEKSVGKAKAPETVVTNQEEGSSADASSPLSQDEYVLPDSDSRYYSQSELADYSNWELYLARNEIFARHGRGFSNQDLVDHFNGCSWYVQVYSPEEFDKKDTSMLNDYERKNAEVIRSVEEKRGSSYLK